MYDTVEKLNEDQKINFRTIKKEKTVNKYPYNNRKILLKKSK